MSDPEILDPEGPRSSSASGASSSSSAPGVERLLAEVQRALPGRVVRVDVSAAQPDRFRIEAEGEGGSLVVESGPLFTVLVSFGGARFTFTRAPTSASDLEQADRAIAERVRMLASQELVVQTQQVSVALRRTLVLVVDGERISGIFDTSVEPHAGTPGPARVASFGGLFNREPTRDETKLLDKLQGGFIGRLKRKVVEKLVDKAADGIRSAIERALPPSQRPVSDAHAEEVADDGKRKLGPTG